MGRVGSNCREGPRDSGSVPHRIRQLISKNSLRVGCELSDRIHAALPRRSECPHEIGYAAKLSIEQACANSEGCTAESRFQRIGNAEADIRFEQQFVNSSEECPDAVSTSQARRSEHGILRACKPDYDERDDHTQAALIDAANILDPGWATAIEQVYH